MTEQGALFVTLNRITRAIALHEANATLANHSVGTVSETSVKLLAEQYHAYITKDDPKDGADAK